MKKKEKNINGKKKKWIKIFLLLNFVNLFIGLLFYNLVPTILNYPPDSINNDFQRALNNGQTYTSQYIIIIALVITIESIFLYFNFKKIIRLQSKINRLKNPDRISSYQELVKRVLNLPYTLYVFQIIAPTMLIALIFWLLGGQIAIILKVAILFGTMCTLISNVSFVFSKRAFKDMLIEINVEQGASIDKNVDLVKTAKRRGIKTNILIFTIPIFIVSTLFTGLIGYTRLTLENGNYIADVYSEKLENIYDTTLENITIASLKESLDNLSYNDENDIYFIITPTGEIVTSDNSSLSEFFIKYIEDKSDSQNNRVYEFYGIDVEGVIKKWPTDDGEWIIGVKYGIVSPTTLVFLLGGLFVLLIINVFLVYYSSKAIADDIKLVSDNLALISKNENVDFSFRLPVTSKDEIGDLVKEFNKIQKLTRIYLTQIRDTQDTIVEKERLASLGQMIGGIAHNLKTPIMSIAGASEALADLIQEYNNSVGDSEVTVDDHHEIAKDMTEWVDKTRAHLAYMSDVITAIKGQAVAFSDQVDAEFTIEELMKHVTILMKHELNNALITLNTNVDIDISTQIKGNINSLVQVVNNIISNAIQAYNGKQHENIGFSIYITDKKLIIKIQDYAGGLPTTVKEKLFKEMITTKGKDGTGLGLFMSYSNIRAHFNGNMRFETEKDKGTTFYIELPL